MASIEKFFSSSNSGIDETAEVRVKDTSTSTSTCICTSLSVDSTEDYGMELFLTPLLKAGHVEQSRTKAKVHGLSQTVESYSGFLTVNEELASNLFFWFFPASCNQEHAPLLIWLQGGPGSTSLIGLFNENGPFQVDADGNLKHRENGSWTLTNSVLYIDNPVGSGFSFTESDEGYATCQQDVSQNLYEALVQFYQLFPELKSNDLYLTGQSYAGKFIPHFGVEIHKRNQDKPRDERINLKGCIIGSSWTDPLIQLDWGEYLYNMGVLDDVGRAIFDHNTRQMKSHIEHRQWLDAFKIMQNDMFAFPPLPHLTTYEKLTGLINTCNLLEEDYAPSCYYYRQFLQNPSTRRAIHVGTRYLHNFGNTKRTVFLKLAEDMPKSEKGNLEFLLNSKYALLLYASQFDVVVPHTAVDALIRALDWNGANEFMKAPREIWKVKCTGKDMRTAVAGYRVESGNLSHYLIRGAGHMAPMDKPEWCFDMVTEFLKRHSSRSTSQSRTDKGNVTDSSVNSL